MTDARIVLLTWLLFVTYGGPCRCSGSDLCFTTAAAHGICGGQSGTVPYLVCVLQFPLSSLIPPSAGSGGQSVANVPCGPGLSASTDNRNCCSTTAFARTYCRNSIKCSVVIADIWAENFYFNEQSECTFYKLML
jgi:hypothetical protein